MKALIFDFGNVVGFFSHHRAAEQLAAYSPLPTQEIYTRLFNAPLEREYDSGTLDTATFRARAREALSLTCDDAAFDRAFSDIFRPNPEVCSLLPLLRRRYSLLLMSNTNELHARWFLQQFAQVLRNFEHLVLSHEVGARKPNPAIYSACLALAGCKPSECLFLDDLDANVEAARALGWQGLVYQPGNDLASQLASHGAPIPSARAS